MSRGRSKISFDGLMQENVLGTFKIIRGFADLRDLVSVSTAMLYRGSKPGHGSGYGTIHLDTPSGSDRSLERIKCVVSSDFSNGCL
ncbi:MAG: hypothetical protein ABI177_10510 [Edaphobacter sp.]